MRYNIPFVSFNITATCNLNCNGCFIGSNFDYQGHSSWQQQRSIYEKWAEKIDIRSWEIYGGEPFLNPEWYDWFVGLSEIWPNANGFITSNGYAIASSKNQKLYDILEKSNGRHWLEVSNHNKDKNDWLDSQIYKFLGDNVTKSRMTVREYQARHGTNYDDLCIETLKNSYNNVKDITWPDVNTLEDWYSLSNLIKQECDIKFDISLDKVKKKYPKDTILEETQEGILRIYTDGNGVSVIMRDGISFSDGAMIVSDHSVALHTSDVQRAYHACYNKICLEFHDGALHQCSSVGHFKGWSEQLPMELTDQQKQLIDSYVPLTAESTVEDIAQWYEHDRNQPMPQCSLCPEKRENFDVYATTKKNKIR